MNKDPLVMCVDEGCKPVSLRLDHDPQMFVDALNESLKGKVVNFGTDVDVCGKEAWLESDFPVLGFRIVEKKTNSRVLNVYGDCSSSEMERVMSDCYEKYVFIINVLTVDHEGNTIEKKLCEVKWSENVYLFWHLAAECFFIGSVQEDGHASCVVCIKVVREEI